MNLNIPRKKQVAFRRKSLESSGSKIWDDMPYHIKCAENLNVFKDLIKKQKTVPPVVATCVPYR